MNHATGLMSAATVSQPSRIASSGMAPPPANGSSTRGARPPNASRISARNRANSSTPSLSLSRPQCRTPPRVSARSAPSTPRPVSTLPAIRASSFRRASRVPGSRKSVASSAARLAASGRRAGQMCSVEICPCRTFFSCTESRETCLSGKAASMSLNSPMTGSAPFRFGHEDDRSRGHVEHVTDQEYGNRRWHRTLTVSTQSVPSGGDAALEQAP